MQCLNCNHEFEGNYCPNCGQRAGIRKLAMGDFFKEIPSSILNLEKRFIRTVKDVLRNPYKMNKDFSEGKRKYYAPPIQFYFFFATITFILRKMFPGAGTVAEPTIDITADPNPGSAAIVERINFGVEKFLLFKDDYANYFELGMPLFFGLSLFLFVRKRLNLAESITFSFFVFSLANYLPFLIFLPLSAFFNVGEVSSIVSVLMIAWACSYLGRRRILNFLLGIFLFIFSISFYGIFFIAIMTLFY